MQNEDQWIRMLSCERRRRLAVAGDEAKTRLLATLDAMSERLRAWPEYIDPTPAEQAENTRIVEAWLAEHSCCDQRENDSTG